MRSSNTRHYFSMFPVGPDGVREISRGFFEIAKEQEPNCKLWRSSAPIAILRKRQLTALTTMPHDGISRSSMRRSYPPNTVDFTPILRAIQATNPDFVYVASYPTGFGRDRSSRKRDRPQDQVVRRRDGGLQFGALKTQLGDVAQQHRRARFLCARADAAIPRYRGIPQTLSGQGGGRWNGPARLLRPAVCLCKPANSRAGGAERSGAWIRKNWANSCGRIVSLRSSGM